MRRTEACRSTRSFCLRVAASARAVVASALCDPDPPSALVDWIARVSGAGLGRIEDALRWLLDSGRLRFERRWHFAPPDLPPGTAKLKKGGGNGGHNGLKDISAQLGTQDYWRLRLGIGHPGDRGAVVNYVLHEPSRDEANLIQDNIDLSVKLLPLLLEGSMEAAMLKLHTKPKAEKTP